MPTMKVRVEVELTPTEVAWFVHEADCLGHPFEVAIEIHCQEALQKLVETYSVADGAVIAETAVERAAGN